MCGIGGIINLNKSESIEKDELIKISKSMAHRGPDECGYFINGNVGLVHNRLSIIDLATGKQPIFNENKKILIVFNGEIYNFKELKPELEKAGHQFYTNTDTEVIVHLYEQYGVDCLKKLKGMFAFAIYDMEKDIVFLARDRLGEKPLKYYMDENRFIFASELKSILSLDKIGKEVDADALSAYFSLLYVPAPLTIFKKIRKIPPGSFAIYKDGKLTIEKYWDIECYHIKGKTEEDYINEIDEQLKETVKSCMISDVPIGVFLSGGIDSSLVTSYLAQLSDKPVKTFSVGFGEFINELPYAQKVADMYKTDHTAINVNPDIEDIIEDIIWYYEEPFGDSSCIPTFIISREARKKVKVILSGDGGDELFAGYESYNGFDRFKALNRPKNILMRYFITFNRLVELKLKLDLYWVFRLINGSHDDNYFYYYKSREYFNEDEKKLLIKNPAHNVTFDLLKPGLATEAISNDDKIFMYDIKYYLPDDLLVKVDIASMANSLEIRAPFLDYQLVEKSFNIPIEIKMKRNVLKYLLKKLAEKRLPREIVYRKKQGFGAPVNNWLKLNIRESVIKKLKDSDHKIYKYLNWEYVQDLLEQFYEKNREIYGYKIWLIFTFALWCEKYL